MHPLLACSPKPHPWYLFSIFADKERRLWRGSAGEVTGTEGRQNPKPRVWGCQARLLYTGSSVVRHPPASARGQERRVRSLDQEDPLEKEMATHSRILAWKIPWTEEPGGFQSTGWQRVRGGD